MKSAQQFVVAIVAIVAIGEIARPRCAQRERRSQTFTLAGALVVVPVILAYTALGYRVFRGKTDHAELPFEQRPS
ncbi:hypothetical protein [Paraburkholderia sacchari]|uniref:hypothetical protein n=1 Tax=Paraburkholderia sacchari TaxID=159450 RepID=UPI00126A61F3|nr:hypothetical protein [Paraburkholderia sacchari]